MSEVTTIQPPRIAVAAEASAGHRLVGPARTDKKPVTDPRQAPAPNLRRAGGQFGQSNNVQINRRSEAPITKLAPQTLTVLQSTLSSLAKFCRGEGALKATQAVNDVMVIVKTIADGGSVADAPTTPTGAK